MEHLKIYEWVCETLKNSILRQYPLDYNDSEIFKVAMILLSLKNK